jgi:autotransporter-associated beta strand protein
MVPLRLDGTATSMTQRRWGRLAGLLCAGVCLFVAGIDDAAAATRRWDGSSSALWSDAANWEENAAPVNGDDLVFPTGASNTVNQNDIVGLQLASVVVATAYTVTGQPITLGAGGITINGASIVTWGLETWLSAAQTWTVSAAAGLVRTGRIELNGQALTLDVAAVMEGAGDILGVGSITKSGNGTLFLPVENFYGGITTIAAGEIVVSHPNALGVSNFGSAASGTVVNAGAALRLDSVALGEERLTLNGSGPSQSGALKLGAGNSSVGGQIVLATDAVVRVPAGQMLTTQAFITGAGGLGLDGDGTLVLGMFSLFTGDLVIGATGPSTGTIRLGAPAATLPDFVDVSLPYAGSTLNLNGTSTKLGTISGVGNLMLGASSLSIRHDSDTTYNGVMSGTGSFGKDGLGRLTSTGIHTVSGYAVISGGTFAQTGGALPADITVGQSATMTLASNPQLGPLRVSGSGTLALDEGGPQIARSLAFELFGATSTLRVVATDATTNPCSQLRVTGTVKLGGKLAVTYVPGATPSNGITCTIIDNDGTDPVVSGFNGVMEGGLVSAGSTGFRVSYVGGDGNDVTLTTASRKYYLSEGATGAFFALDILLANPNTEAVPVELTFLRTGNPTPLVETLQLAPLSRRTVKVNEINGLQDVAVSTVVSSMNGLPILVERTMRWDSTGYGAHTDKAADGPALKWYFAEGSQGFFDTFILLANPLNELNGATIDYLLDNAPPVTGGGDIAAQSRTTLWVSEQNNGALRNQSFGFVVTFNKPAIAERAMYFGNSGQVWAGGHESAGVNALSTSWFLAEGATGPFFETFVLLANPNDAPAEVTLRFLPASGVPISVTKPLPGRSRLTVNIEAEHPLLANVPVATQVTSTQPIVVERAQYWPDPASTWYEAHNSFGVTQLGTRWGLAEGRVGGPSNYQTYILLANPGTVKANVTVQFLRTSGVPVTKTFEVDPASRYNVSVGPGSLVPELQNEEFGAVITSTQPLAVERALYSDANGQVWAAGTNATAARLP